MKDKNPFKFTKEGLENWPDNADLTSEEVKQLKKDWDEAGRETEEYWRQYDKSSYFGKLKLKCRLLKYYKNPLKKLIFLFFTQLK